MLLWFNIFRLLLTLNLLNNNNFMTPQLELGFNPFQMETLIVPKDYLFETLVDGAVYVFDIIEWAWTVDLFTEVEETQFGIIENSRSVEWCLFLTGGRNVLKNLVYFASLADELGYFDFIKSIHQKYYFKFAPDGTLCSMYHEGVSELLFSREFYRHIIYEYIIDKNEAFKYSNTISTCVLVYQSFTDYLIFIAAFITIFGIWINVDRVLSGKNVVYFDYSASFASAISEKELNSWDDIMHITSIFFFFFGWFSYSYGIIHSVHAVEISTVLLFIPFLTYTLVMMPVFLLGDYGSSLINYLRGTSSTSSFAVEFLFDYVTAFAFLMRNYVQNVRFLIILLVCYGMNEIIIYIDFAKTFVTGMHNVVIDTIESNYSFKSVSYEIYWFFTRTIAYIIYEAAHTFFITVVQLSSFLIMVFWLFSFLYTYFVIETQETFFSVARKMRADQFAFNVKYRGY